MKIKKDHLRQILQAESIDIGLCGTISLRGVGGVGGVGGVQVNVARIDGGVVRHHPDMSGNERQPEWREAIEQALSLICPYCGQWNLLTVENCLNCGQPVEV